MPLAKKELIRDLTHLAGQGKLDPAHGREDEILMIAEVFSRHNPKSVILVGPSGVGKTHLVNGLAVAGVRGMLSGLLEEIQLVELDSSLVDSFVEGSEERLSGIMDFLRRESKAILAIDNIDKFLLRLRGDAKAAEGIAPLALAILRRTIMSMGTCGAAGYADLVREFPEIEQQFERIEIAPMLPAATLRVLEKLRDGVERHHGLRITHEALREAIMCSEQYSPHACFPGKAIELLDRACSRARLKTVANKPVKKEGYTPSGPKALVEVLAADVRQEAERRSSQQIPLFRLPDVFDELRRDLPQRLHFQRSAAATAAQLVETTGASLDRLRLPKTVLLFIGKEGMGQTTLIKTLAQRLFGSDEAVFNLDISAESKSSWTEQLGTLLASGGSPSGTLRPHGIVAFRGVESSKVEERDRIETLIKTGTYENPGGESVDGSATIIIFLMAMHGDDHGATSNFGRFQQYAQALGKTLFDRIDAVIPFRTIEPDQFQNIIHARIKLLRKEFQTQELGIAIQPSAYEYLVQRAINKRIGPERLLEATEKLIVKPILQITGIRRFRPKTVLYALMENDRIVIRAQEPESHKKSN